MDKFDASVTSGIFRLTRIDTNENEWIVDYSFENDFVCDYPSLILNYYGNLHSLRQTTRCSQTSCSLRGSSNRKACFLTQGEYEKEYNYNQRKRCGIYIGQYSDVRF